MRATVALVILLGACGGRPAPVEPTRTTPPTPTATPTWDVPAGWRGETIPFPLDFAPTLAHRGVEELRFPPGFFEPTSPEYWSYTFVWRLDDRARLDGEPLSVELTTYFRGLIAAVDTEGKITARDQIVATAAPIARTVRADPWDLAFELHAHVFDAFKTGLPLDLNGWAARTGCPDGGAIWVFVLTPNPAMDKTLTALADAARCGQRPPVAAPTGG